MYIVASHNNVHVWLSQPCRGYTPSGTKTKHINGTHPVYRAGREKFAGDPSAETKGPKGGMRSVEKRSDPFQPINYCETGSQDSQDSKEVKKNNNKQNSELSSCSTSWFYVPVFHFLSFLIHFQRFHTFPDLALTGKQERSTMSDHTGVVGDSGETLEVCHAINSTS